MKLDWKIMSGVMISGLLLIGARVSTAPSGPVVSSVQGSVSQGSTVTITGSGFGTKSNSAQSVSAAPLVWDVTSQQYLGGQNLNAYAGLGDGSGINTRVWQLIQENSGETVRYSTSRPQRNPRVSAHYTTNNDKLSLGLPVYPNGASVPPSTQTKFYISFYRKLKNGANTSGGGDGSTKLLRVASSPSLSGLGSNIVTAALYGFGNVAAWIDAGTETDWVRWEMYVDRDKQWFDVWKNGHYHQGSWSGAGGNVELRPASDWRFRLPGLSGYAFDASFPSGEPIVPYLFGYDDGHGASSGQEIDVSEVYHDNTLTRVEVSNLSTWNDAPSSSATREVQGRLLTWNDSSVSFAFNQGSFNTGQTVYVYVIDANGNVNANGYPVVIGGSTTSTPPAAPKNFRKLS